MWNQSWCNDSAHVYSEGWVWGLYQGFLPLLNEVTQSGRNDKLDDDNSNATTQKMC